MTSPLWWIPAIAGAAALLVASGYGFPKWACLLGLIPVGLCTVLACASVRAR